MALRNLNTEARLQKEKERERHRQFVLRLNQFRRPGETFTKWDDRRIGENGLCDCRCHKDEQIHMHSWSPCICMKCDGCSKHVACFPEHKCTERCVQCRNPHHDGLCTCGQWGEAEEKKAREWYAKNCPH